MTLRWLRRSLVRKALTGFAGAVMFCSGALAADIWVQEPEQSQGQAIVVIAGPLVSGDSGKFQSVTSFISRAVVVLGSDGGMIAPAIEIGQAIRLKGYFTFIPDGVRCASSCALAWLGGARRFAGVDASIGFHAAYSRDTGQESGVANAVVGAYLTQIGLPMSAVIYITQSAPGSMTWLNFSEAAAHGIEVESVSPEQATAPPPPIPVQPTPPTPPPVAPFSAAQPQYEPATRALISELFSQWPAPREDIYLSYVDYYGKARPRMEVLDDKRKFIIKWPQRSYVIQSLAVQCALDNKAGGTICQASTDATWEVRSSGRGLRGTMRAFFRILWDGNGSSGPKVLAESSDVISREKRQESIDTLIPDWIAKAFK